MIGFLKKLLGGGPAVDWQELVQNGAQIIDVRTEAEFRSGHLKGSVNIPVQVLGKNLKRIKKDRPVITCCASGMRSASAKRMLKTNGYDQVYNGGPWPNLQRRLH